MSKMIAHIISLVELSFIECSIKDLMKPAKTVIQMSRKINQAAIRR